jgi:hypothetical protein
MLVTDIAGRTQATSRHASVKVFAVLNFIKALPETITKSETEDA